MKKFQSYFSIIFVLCFFIATTTIISCSQSQETPENNPILSLSKTAPNYGNGEDMDVDAVCQCVAYVKNKKALIGGVGYTQGAYQMGLSLLPSNGYYQVTTNTPQVGDIILYMPTYGGGIDPIYGHTGIINSVINVTGGKKINVRGSNQGGSLFTDAGCTNVSNAINSTITSVNFSKIQYWRK